MELFVLVTVDEKEEEILGVFSSEELVKEAAKTAAQTRKQTAWGFAYFPMTLDKLVAK